MNTQASYYLKVGLFTLIALCGTVGIFLFLYGSLTHGKTFTVVFDDAHGIKDKEIVRMAGVDIGQVGDVHLTPDNKAQMSVAVNKGVRIPLGSRFTISNSILGNQSILVIVPSDSPQDLPDGATVTGDSSDPISQAMTGAGQVLQTVQQTLLKSQVLVQKLTDSASLLSDPKRVAKIDAMLNNLDASTAGLPRMEMKVERELDSVGAQTNQLLAGMNQTRATADKVVGGASKLTDNLNDTLTENRKTLKSLLHNANDAANSVAGLIDQMRTTLGDPKIHDSLVGASGNMAAATANLQSISAKLDATASDVQRLADDPRMNADVRETVSNLRATSESVKSLVNRVETIHIPGERRRPDTSGGDSTTSTPAAPATPHYFSLTSLMEPGLVFDSTYDTKRERLRFDAVLWAVRIGGSAWSEFFDRFRASIPSFVLISDNYDHDLARSLAPRGGFLLASPVQERKLSEVLREIAARTPPA